MNENKVFTREIADHSRQMQRRNILQLDLLSEFGLQSARNTRIADAEEAAGRHP